MPLGSRLGEGWVGVARRQGAAGVGWGVGGGKTLGGIVAGAPLMA